MNLRTFLIVAAFLAAGFGFGLIWLPVFMNTTYGLGTSPAELLLSRFFGVELLVLGIVSWMERDYALENARPLIIGSLVGDSVAAYYAFLATRNGVMNSMGWMVFAIYFVLALGFAYFQFKAPAR